MGSQYESHILAGSYINRLKRYPLNQMNPGLKSLHPYPFEKFNQLLESCTPNPDKRAISLAIGEPKHPTPEFILDSLRSNLKDIAIYPSTRGTPELREAISEWLTNRFNLPSDSIDPEKHVLPVNGTREALFAIAQTVIDSGNEDPIVIMPNPFYQIYEGAALLAGAEPYYLDCNRGNGFIPDLESVSENIWQRCKLIYICSPGNPSGAVIDENTVKQLLDLAEQYDFVVASDECYSEIYQDEACPPVGLLEYADKLGNHDYKRCLVFHSLSKRSNVPGLRSGFVAGDAALINEFFRYRTYHGCAMPLHTQKASIAAWQDEAHVIENREKYREKFQQVCKVLSSGFDVEAPPASFYLWPRLPGPDTDFAKALYTQENIKVLPGSYLSRENNGENPGRNHIRIALVAELKECIEAANRMNEFIETYY